MMHADRFVADAKYRSSELQTTPEDMPLVAHFCGAWKESRLPNSPA